MESLETVHQYLLEVKLIYDETDRTSDLLMDSFWV